MKITIDTESNVLKLGRKIFDELDESEKSIVTMELSNFLINNTKLSEYEMDSIWMSYRYCIGRHTIASHMRANDIWKHSEGRMTKEIEIFTAFDINREIENHLRYGFNFPAFYFPITAINRIYSTAVDIVCDFMEKFDIKSEEDLCKYKDVRIKLYDNAEGYTFEVTTWEEYLRSSVHKLLSDYFNNDSMSEDYAWNYFEKWRKEKFDIGKDLEKEFENIINEMPNPKHCYMHNFEDLFVWNDLVHCFDHEHHHKSILTDGTECEWFWSYANKTEKRDDGYYYRTFGYKKIRVPVNEWNGSHTTYIPDDAIKEDIY